ncbi:MAG: SixA phosphatase family protein [Solirubrobacteraceae bacterium]
MADAKHLLLLRHAKSSWDDPTLDDHERPLAPRGRKAARLIAAHLRDNHVQVSLVLCSSAQRARDTLELVQPPGQVLIERGLYDASAQQLLERLRKVPDEHDAVMLVGHNPAIEDLAGALTGCAAELAGQKFPTGALATLTFSGPWAGLAPDAAVLESFVRPRQLG